MNSKKNWLKIFSFFLLMVLFASCSGGGGGGMDNTTIQTSPAVIPSTTKVLDNSTVNNISSVSPDGAQITFSGTNSQIDSLEVGDVVASGSSSSTPSGLLRKVTSIDKTGNQIVANTTGVTIEEAIQKGSWSITQSLNSNQVVKTVSVAKGVKLAKSASLGKFDVSINNVVLYDNDGNTNSANDQIVANGSISIEPSYTFSGDIDNFKLEKLTFTNTTKETCSITLSSNASLANFSKNIEIAKYNLPTVTILVGSFPVVITPVLTVNVGLSGNVSVGISTGIVQEASYTNGLSYDSNNGWSKIKDQTKSFTFTPPTVTAAATAKCYAGPKLELLLYGSAGPYASANGYLELDANPSNNPWWQLYGGIEASAGVELVILSHLVASYNANIFDERVLITQANGGFTPPSYSMSGTIHTYSNSGPVLSGATVSIAGKTVTTNSNGGFSITGIPSGTYAFSVSRFGWDTYTNPAYYVGSNQTGLSFYLNAAPPFGALAINSSTMAAGLSGGFSSIDPANARALQECGAGCSIVFEYSQADLLQ